jgi:hypothetical protein
MAWSKTCNLITTIDLFKSEGWCLDTFPTAALIMCRSQVQIHSKWASTVLNILISKYIDKRIVQMKCSNKHSYLILLWVIWHGAALQCLMRFTFIQTMKWQCNHHKLLYLMHNWFHSCPFMLMVLLITAKMSQQWL